MKLKLCIMKINFAIMNYHDIEFIFYCESYWSQKYSIRYYSKYEITKMR